VANRKVLPFKIQVLNRQRQYEIAPASVTLICTGVFLVLGKRSAAVEVIFVGARKMCQLNRKYRGKNYGTDVLSFRYPGEKADGLPFLGEIVIAPQIAQEQAVRYGGTIESEIRRLVIHGLLHLLGYDHETDDGDMIRLQNRLICRRSFSAGSPIIKARSCQ
jgi:probable rRNA maturation factor